MATAALSSRCRRAGVAAVTVISLAACGSAATPTGTPSASPSSPSSAPINPSVRMIGEEEMIYDWSTDRCDNEMLPDLPVRPFRDAENRVQLNLSFWRNYRLIGSDFDSLEPDCQVTLDSAVDPDPSHYRFKEWVGSTYTLDGRTVYALIHNEWYGREASRWDSVRDFGTEQGAGRWYYQSWVSSTYQNMRYDAANGRWQGPPNFCQIGQTWAHPELGCDATRTWVSPVDATVSVSGVVSDADPGGGNGVAVTILKGAQQLWTATIANGDTDGQRFSVDVPVRRGDRLYFRVNARGDSNYDSTAFNAAINMGPPPCPSNVHNDCLMMSITAAVSTDAGRTFTRDAAPDHLVAVLPYRWTPDAGHLAMWQPSNIVKSPRDEYYYALIQIDRRLRGETGLQGMCLMRTRTLADARSWRAWDGTAFNLSFVDPYATRVEAPAQQTCTPVSQGTVGALSYNLSYNSFLDRFVAVGHDVFKDPPGFYYSVSEDLIHWSPKELLMAADLVQTTNGRTPYLAYPSLVSHDSPARNFDVTGQSPYLYFTRVNGFDPLDFDLVRVRVTFET